jgi:hypothetical protein
MKILIIILTIISHGKAHQLSKKDVDYIRSYRQTSLNYAMDHNKIIRNCEVGDNMLHLLSTKGTKNELKLIK